MMNTVMRAAVVTSLACLEGQSPLEADTSLNMIESRGSHFVEKYCPDDVVTSTTCLDYRVDLEVPARLGLGQAFDRFDGALNTARVRASLRQPRTGGRRTNLVSWRPAS
jgi:hypothetical protein